jgi:dienelactone hydrolase
LPCTSAERAGTALIAALCLLAAAGCGGVAKRADTAAAASPGSRTIRTSGGAGIGATTTTTTSRRTVSPPRPHAPFAVGERIVTFIDRSRRVRIPGQGLVPRTLVTLVRYPAQGPSSRTDVMGAAPERSAGRFPLIIFGHGFSITPTPYAPLLQAWARAGYVVAAPIFPLENANAPGGPNENDLVNQPRDMSFLITQMLTADRVKASFVYGLLDRSEVAVTGQSDGGETALAVAYDRQFIDRRVRAAAILSGAKIPGVGGFDFPAPSPPLLATQGTADTINPPSFTHSFYDGAPRPKFLVDLFGADHLGPYTGAQPFTGIVERVTIAFMDHYLKHGTRGLRRMRSSGNVGGVAALEYYP